MMRLEEYRVKKELSYEDLARFLCLNTTKTFRICKEKDICIRLVDAHKIVQVTQGEVDYPDLVLEGDC